MEWSWRSHEFSLQIKTGPLAIGPALVASWIRGLDVSDAAPSVPVIGAGAQVLDRTDPGYEPGTGTLTVLASKFRAWLPVVTAGGTFRLSEIDFTMLIKSRAGLQLPVIDTVDFHFTEGSDGRAQGSPDPSETVLTIQAMKILRNGVQL